MPKTRAPGAKGGTPAPGSPAAAARGGQPRPAGAAPADAAAPAPAAVDRRLSEEASACADLPVDGVHARRRNADEHLGGACLGARGVDELEDIRSAEGVLANRAHRHRCCIQARVSADPGEDMAASTETASA